MLAGVLLFVLSTSFAHANSVDLLSFMYLQNGAPVANFYNGGSGNPGVPNFGVTFSNNFMGLTSEFNGGAGAFLPDPSQTPVIFNNAATGWMNVSGGFTNGLNFFYTASAGQTVQIWSGSQGQGTLLATINLTANDGNCSAVGYCNWTDVGVKFTGTAGSVTFMGPANTMGLADITIGQSTSAVPEPSSLYLLGTGLAFFCAQGLRRLVKR